MDTDVLVVGAGPAGAIAALVLARAGARVHLLDRSRFPRDKLCGDTLNPGSLSILDRLGISAPIRARAEAVTGMLVTGPGAHVAADYPDGLCGASISRRDHANAPDAGPRSLTLPAPESPGASLQT